jgi:signal peptide peptidase SppA
MRYLHLLSAYAAEPWAMQPEKLAAITGLLLFQARGGKFGDDELQARISNARAREAATAPGGVAIIPVHGVISQRASMLGDISESGTSTEAIGQAFRKALADDTVRAIIFDGDSPGGGTYGIDELATEIRDARGVKPIIGQVNSLVASAAYYLLSQCDEIVCTPSGEAGSVGVYGVHEDVSEAMAKEGVKPTLIRGEKGVHKGETMGFLPLTDDARAYLQERVNRAEDAFIRAVALGRKTTQSNVIENFGKGRMFGAQELVKRGMADRVGTLRETLQRFGAEGPRYAATADSRRAFAAGTNPSLAQIEDVLREAGFPKALAVNFVSAGKGALRSDAGPDETHEPPTPDAKASLAALIAGLNF